MYGNYLLVFISYWLYFVTRVNTQYGEFVESRYEYMNRTEQREIWNRYFQDIRGRFLLYTTINSSTPNHLRTSGGNTDNLQL